MNTHDGAGGTEKRLPSLKPISTIDADESLLKPAKF